MTREFEQTDLTKLLLEAMRCAVHLAEEDGPESDILFINKLKRLSTRIHLEKLDFKLVSRED